MSLRRCSLVVAFGLLAGALVIVAVRLNRASNASSFESAWAARLRWDESVAKRAISERGGDPDFRNPGLILEAAILARQGRTTDATKKLQRLSPDWRERPEAKQIRGELLYAAGALRDAESLFLSLLNDDPSCGAVHLWLGVIYYDRMQFDRFMREMERAIQLTPDDFRPHRLVGLMYHRVDRYAESAQYFQEALRLGGVTGQEDIVGHLARALLFNRDYSGVIDLVAKIPEPSGDLWSNLGEAHLNLGSSDEVVNNCVEQALKSGRHQRRVLHFVSQIYIDSGRVEEAVAYLNELLETAPHFQGAHYLLSRAYQKLGRQADYELAIKRLKVAEKIKKEHGDLMQRILEHPDDMDALRRAESLAVEMGEPGLAKMYAVARTSGISKDLPKQ